MKIDCQYLNIHHVHIIHWLLCNNKCSYDTFGLIPGLTGKCYLNEEVQCQRENLKPYAWGAGSQAKTNRIAALNKSFKKRSTWKRYEYFTLLRREHSFSMDLSFRIWGILGLKVGGIIINKKLIFSILCKNVLHSDKRAVCGENLFFCTM